MRQPSIRREKGATNAIWQLTNPALPMHHALDTRRCDRGATHDVRDEWETRGGMRTGRLTLYCHTCRRVVAPIPQPAPDDTYQYKNKVRSLEFHHAKKGAA